MYAFDIETRSLKPSKEDFALAAIYSTEGEFSIMSDYDEVVEFLATDPVLIGHNIVSFDLSWFPHRPTLVYDTMIMSKLLNREAIRRHNLGECLGDIGIEHTEKELDVANREWDAHNLTKQELSYIRQDVENLLALHGYYYEILAVRDLLSVLYKEQRVRLIADKLERRGLPVLESNIYEAEQSAHKELDAILTKHNRDNININSHVQINRAIFGNTLRQQRLKAIEEADIPFKYNKKGEPVISTNKETRQRLIMNNIASPTVTWIDKAKSAAAPLKHLTWLRECVDGDRGNRCHSRYDNLRTKTGRFAASSYAIQQMNRKLRTCFGREGYKVVKVDWSQMELRLHAALNDDKDMIEAYEQGIDLHVALAKDAFGVSEPTKEQRDLGKTGNFTLLYMGGARRLHGRLIELGQYVEAGVALALYSAFHDRYPTIRATADDILARAQETFPEPFILHIWGGLQADMEWKRDEGGLWNFPLPAAMNYYIQGAGGAVLKDALLLLDSNTDIVDRYLGATVHDELVWVDVPEDDVERVAALCKAAMEASLAEALKPTTINPAVDVTIGDTWGG